MKESDKELSKASGLAAVDAVTAGIDAHMGGLPLATGAWGLSKALLGKGLALRQKKALEWVEMIKDNPRIFTKEILETQEFQDAFVICLEAYIKERSDEKRVLLRNIFKDYTSVSDPANYPLERFYEITKQITLRDAKNFSYIKMIASESKPGISIETDRGKLESTLHLISLGLLIQDDVPRFVKEQVGASPPRVFMSSLGINYLKFIDTPDNK